MPSPEVVMLLWHGRGHSEADVFAGLLGRLGAGVLALTPQWDSGAVDGGRGALLPSLDRAMGLAERRRCALLLGGWSLGATAALDVAMNAGLRRPVGAVLGLAVDPRACSPVSGVVLAESTTPGPGPALSLVHGVDDDPVPVAACPRAPRARRRASMPPRRPRIGPRD